MKTVGYGRWEAWHFVLAAALGALGVMLAWPAWMDIYTIAGNDEEQSHIFLVPIVAAWMFWARRVRLRNCPPSGTFVGPLIVAAGIAASVVGYDFSVQSLWHAGAVTILVGCILTVLGKNVLFQFFPAFLVLVFLVPIPGAVRQAVSIPLQEATASATRTILDAFGVPVVQSGNLLLINQKPVAVAEACNGMRMVFALALVSYAFAFSIPLRNSSRALVLAFSPVAALACNVVRMIPTVLLYGYSSQEIADDFHDVSGWLMLPLAFMLLLGVLRAVKWSLLPVMRFNLAYQ
ncbi:MAG TPA: exosortase/archaeosortase family protein [Phycisphaerales bacterium]|nr:exosortase/archaeosortase family protein [Phycisphaerales bacterium]